MNTADKSSTSRPFKGLDETVERRVDESIAIQNPAGPTELSASLRRAGRSKRLGVCGVGKYAGVPLETQNNPTAKLYPVGENPARPPYIPRHPRAHLHPFPTTSGGAD